VTLPSYPHPERIARLIRGASAVVGGSLHLGITAVAFGVPVFRPAQMSGGKYAVLSRHPNVHVFDADGSIDCDWFEARLKERNTADAMKEISARLERHRDLVASSFSAGRDRPERLGTWLQVSALLEPMSKLQRLEDALAERDAQIGRLDASLTERDQRIASLDAEVTKRDNAVSTAKAEAERALRDTKAHKDKVRALRNSASWKLTAPFRRIVRLMRRRAGREASVIRLDRIAQQPLHAAPYQWAFVDGLFRRRMGESLVRTYPCDNYKTVKGYDGEKGYEYEARALIHMNACAPSFPEGLRDSWRRLAEGLLSPTYRAGGDDAADGPRSLERADGSLCLPFRARRMAGAACRSQGEDLHSRFLLQRGLGPG